MQANDLDYAVLRRLAALRPADGKVLSVYVDLDPAEFGTRPARATEIGSLLDEAERREIESHVTHTWRFLQQIPWTRELRNIPEIAYGHHEKLDGSVTCLSVRLRS